MKKFLIVVYVAFSLMFLTYLALPLSEFPEKLPDSLQSDEPADTETLSRRAYFTNFTRQEVMDHYKNNYEFSESIKAVSKLNLNYPPEESQTLIRDQTMSTFLEELVHPMRDSIYINGFEPTDDNKMIYIKNKKWRQKIIVRHVESTTLVRLLVGLLVIIAIPTLCKEWVYTYKKLIRR